MYFIVFRCPTISFQRLLSRGMSLRQASKTYSPIWNMLLEKQKPIIQNGVKLRGRLFGKGVRNQEPSVVKGEMAMEGCVDEHIPLKDGT